MVWAITLAGGQDLQNPPQSRQKPHQTINKEFNMHHTTKSTVTHENASNSLTDQAIELMENHLSEIRALIAKAQAADAKEECTSQGRSEKVYRFKNHNRKAHPHDLKRIEFVVSISRKWHELYGESAWDDRDFLNKETRKLHKILTHGAASYVIPQWTRLFSNRPIHDSHAVSTIPVMAQPYRSRLSSSISKKRDFILYVVSQWFKLYGDPSDRFFYYFLRIEIRKFHDTLIEGVRRG